MRHKLTLYSTSSCPIFKDYMDTRRSEWEEEKDFTADQVRAMSLKKYNKLLTSGRWSTKDPKDNHILALVVLAQNLSEEFKKSSEKSNTSKKDTTNGESAYIRDLPPFMPEYPKVGVKKKQGLKRIMVVQGTPRCKRPVGPPQSRRPREANWHLTKRRRRH